MEDRHVQAIRYKLQKRIRRLNSAEARLLPHVAGHFLAWFDSSPILVGVRDELMKAVSEKVLTEDVEAIIGGQPLVADSEVEAAAMGYCVIKKLAESPDGDLFRFTHRYPGVKDIHDAADRFREMFVEPFYEYIDEHIDDQQAIVYFLRKYKQRCEWFRRDELRAKAVCETRKAEASLANDLYEYLHDQGIDFSIEPHTASGRPDLLTEQVGDDKLLADAKLFWPTQDKRSAYIIKGFNQLYTYTRDLNEPFGYLVVFKMCEEDLKFMLPPSDTLFPCLTYNNKTVFFVVVDICDYQKTASERGKLRVYEITEQDLIEAVHEEKAQTERRLSSQE